LTGKDGMSMVGNGGRESEFLVSKVYGVNEILYGVVDWDRTRRRICLGSYRKSAMHP